MFVRHGRTPEGNVAALATFVPHPQCAIGAIGGDSFSLKDDGSLT